MLRVRRPGILERAIEARMSIGDTTDEQRSTYPRPPQAPHLPTAILDRLESEVVS